MIGVDRIAGLPTTVTGFDMIKSHVDLLSGQVHAVPTRSTSTVTPTPAGGFDMLQNHADLLSGRVLAAPTRATATATDAATIFCDMCFRSYPGFPDHDVRVVDYEAELTSGVFLAFVKSMGSYLIVGSADHKNVSAKVERGNGVSGDTLHAAFAHGRKDDWDRHLALAELAINTAASTLNASLSLTAEPIPAFRFHRRATIALRPQGCAVVELLAAAQADVRTRQA